MSSDHHEIPNSLTFNEKLIKILAHWKAHNADHAETYRMWAERAKTENLTQAGDLLEEAAEMTLQVSKKFIEAIEIVERLRIQD